MAAFPPQRQLPTAGPFPALPPDLPLRAREGEFLQGAAGGALSTLACAHPYPAHTPWGALHQPFSREPWGGTPLLGSASLSR